MVKNTCSCREPRSDSQCPHGCSQPYATTVPGALTYFSDTYLSTRHEHLVLRQNTHTHKINTQTTITITTKQQKIHNGLIMENHLVGTPAHPRHKLQNPLCFSSPRTKTKQPKSKPKRNQTNLKTLGFCITRKGGGICSELISCPFN